MKNLVELATKTTSLDSLAVRINQAHAACVAATRDALSRGREVGLLLIEAKRLCGHGRWLPWLRENFEGSERSAQIYVRVAKRWQELEAKSAGSADLTLDGALRLLADPKPQPLAPVPDLDGKTTWHVRGEGDTFAEIAPLPSHPGFYRLATFNSLDAAKPYEDYDARGLRYTPALLRWVMGERGFVPAGPWQPSNDGLSVHDQIN